jgi:hypothetical protein
MKKAVLTIVLLLPLLTGCGFLEKFRKPVPPTPTIAVDVRLLELCKDLPLIDSASSFQDLAQHYVGIIGLYGDCSSRQRAGVEALKSLENKK